MGVGDELSKERGERMRRRIDGGWVWCVGKYQGREGRVRRKK